MRHFVSYRHGNAGIVHPPVEPCAAGVSGSGMAQRRNSLPREFDVFLSYHWRDQREVDALARKLREQGLKVFLDRWYLTPGQPWPKE